jgi:hypothetical protein
MKRTGGRGREGIGASSESVRRGGHGSCADGHFKGVISFNTITTKKANTGWSRDRAVGIATGGRIDDQGIGVRVQVASRVFSSSHHPD